MKIVVFNTSNAAHSALKKVNNIGAYLYRLVGDTIQFNDGSALNDVSLVSFSATYATIYYDGEAKKSPIAIGSGNTGLTTTWTSVQKTPTSIEPEKWYFVSPRNTSNVSGVKLPNGKTISEVLDEILPPDQEMHSEWIEALDDIE